MDQDVERSTLREKGQLTLPREVRDALHVDPGDEIEFQVLSNGDVTMRGLKLIPADQAWFWTATWQAGEAEASRDIAEGRVESFKDAESLLDALDG